MKKTLILSIIVLSGLFASAQVEKAIIVEHFTNSVCGLCASKNPGLYQNLASNPDVMHIAFHPSSPYASCIFSQHNPVENDNRTKHYSIYGGTPWIVINGQVQSSGTNFGNPDLFDPFYGETSPFSIYIKEYRFEENDIQVEVTIKAVSSHSQDQAVLMLGFAEDTVFYDAPNGEDLHGDVFRKALTDIEGELVALPVAGDSITMMYNVTPNEVWNLDRMYTMAILQDPSSDMLLQAGKTNEIEYMDPNFIGFHEKPAERLFVFPNPLSGPNLTISNAEENILIYSFDGRLLNEFDLNDNQKVTLDISFLSEGIYILRSGVKSVKLTVVK